MSSYYTHQQQDEKSHEYEIEKGHRSSIFPWIIVGIILIIAFA